MQIKKYFLCIIMLCHATALGTSFGQGITDFSNNCINFACYTKSNPRFAVAMLAAISGGVVPAGPTGPTKIQSAVGGAMAGAAVGAGSGAGAFSLQGALIGGVVGACGGYLAGN